jgi:hypothetical protein
MARAAGKRKEFDRWPRFEALWMRGFQRIWERRTAPDYVIRGGGKWFGKTYFHNWREMWEWWLSNDSLPEKLTDEDEEDSCQTALDMFSGGAE